MQLTCPLKMGGLPATEADAHAQKLLSICPKAVLLTWLSQMDPCLGSGVTIWG